MATTGTALGQRGGTYLDGSGRTVVAGSQLLVPDGNVGVPSIARSEQPTQGTGLIVSGNTCNLAAGGTVPFAGNNLKAATTLPFAVVTGTTAERTALSPSAGWIVFDSDLSAFYGYNGSAWVAL